jgi:hypothetical protein
MAGKVSFHQGKDVVLGILQRLVVIKHGIDFHRVSGEFFPFQATFALRPHFPPIRDGHLQ